MENYVSVWPVIVLALIHFLGSRLSFLSGIPRSIWLSAAGGVSVAYIFLHLFPELNKGQAHLKELETLEFLKHHIYLIALAGLIIFYGLERAVITAKEENIKDEARAGIFWVHIGSFAVYNALIGYILYQREEGTLEEMLLYAVAMALHFIINDIGLLEHHNEAYRKYGRWVLVGSLLAGWATGLILPLPESVIMMVLAFIGGGVILNVLKEELPEKRKSRYWAFILGAGAYSILLLSI